MGCTINLKCKQLYEEKGDEVVLQNSIDNSSQIAKQQQLNPSSPSHKQATKTMNDELAIRQRAPTPVYLKYKQYQDETDLLELQKQFNQLAIQQSEEHDNKTMLSIQVKEQQSRVRGILKNKNKTTIIQKEAKMFSEKLIDSFLQKQEEKQESKRKSRHYKTLCKAAN